MTTDEYVKLAQRTSSTCNNGEKIVNAALGLAGESGEFADHVKKAAFQGHDFDKHHMALELGDILWYIVEAAESIGVTLDEIMWMNINKIGSRYPGAEFKAECSINREEMPPLDFDKEMAAWDKKHGIDLPPPKRPGGWADNV